MKRGRKNSAGFTLMEIVVAISLMSLVMLTVAMGMRLSANAFARGERNLNQHAEVLAGTEAMSQQISSAAVRTVIEYRGPDKIPTPVVGFLGTPSEMRFCTRTSWRGDRSRPQFMAQYRVVKDLTGKQQLLVSESGLTDDNSVLTALYARATETGQAVGSPADQIEFQYYQPATRELPAQWLRTWEPIQDAELPSAVLVRWTRDGAMEEGLFPIAIYHEVKTR